MMKFSWVAFDVFALKLQITKMPEGAGEVLVSIVLLSPQSPYFPMLHFNPKRRIHKGRLSIGFPQLGKRGPPRKQQRDRRDRKS